MMGRAAAQERAHATMMIVAHKSRGYNVFGGLGQPPSDHVQRFVYRPEVHQGKQPEDDHDDHQGD